MQKAASIAPHGSDLGAIEHVIYLMMENRSYDHYFGAYRQGRGFDDHPADSLGVFAQAFPDGADLHPCAPCCRSTSTCRRVTTARSI